MPNTPDTDPLAFAARLHEALNDQGRGGHGKGVWLAKLTEVAGPTAHGWLKGQHRPEADKVRAIAQALKVNFEWLMFGRGGKAAGDAAESVDHRFVNWIRGAKLSAGSGELVFDHYEVEQSHAFKSSWLRKKGIDPERAKMWTVSGDSMDPIYPDGCAVLIDMARREPVHGKVFALIGEDGLRLKQLRRTHAGWEMYSYNPDQIKYPPEPIVSDNYAIIGQLRWSAREED